MSDNNVTENAQTMADALKSVETVHIGDTVKGEVLAVEDKQLIVGIEAPVLKVSFLLKNFLLSQSMTFGQLRTSVTSLIWLSFPRLVRTKKTASTCFPSVVWKRKRFGKKSKPSLMPVKPSPRQ